MDARKNGWISRMGIVILAAVLVEVISISQYQRIRSIMQEEMDIRSRVVVRNLSDKVRHTLEMTESTMRENLWDVERSIVHPDSTFACMVRLIDDNPHVDGGCLAFIPNYYPSKGRLFEPYASKNPDGSIRVQQIAGPDHDYTLNEEYTWVVDSDESSWSDPYFYGPDSVAFTTYSYPIKGPKGNIVAVCGLDVDLSWLGDTLNSRQPYPSSYCLLLTPEGDLVAGPPEGRVSESEVEKVVDVVNGRLLESALPGMGLRKTSLSSDPYWQLIQVYKTDEVFAKMRKQRHFQVILVLLCLAIMTFVINRYARNERNLLRATEEQARMGGELAVASRIQQEMLPKLFPSYVYGSLEPAREVGGDVYDFYTRDGKLFFCIGDVSGKGVPAAMLMSVAHSLFRIVSSKEERPSRILQSLNVELSRGNDSNMFMTYFVACLDLYSGELRYASAGHDKPFVLNGGKISLLPAKANLPLGVFPGVRFEEHSCTLEPGTTLLLYTDGLTEAKNMARAEFGRDGIEAVLRRFIAAGDQSLGQLVSSLSTAAHDFASEAPQSDDLTMLAVRFNPENVVREQLVLQNQTEEVTRLGAFIKDFLVRLDMDNKTAAGIRLALEEAVVNVIDYAYPAGEEGSVSILADTNGKEVRFTIIDAGFPFDPTAVMDPDTTLDAKSRPIGGLGILLSRKLMDSVSYTRTNGQNVLSLTKTIL